MRNDMTRPRYGLYESEKWKFTKKMTPKSQTQELFWNFDFRDRDDTSTRLFNPFLLQDWDESLVYVTMLQ